MDRQTQIRAESDTAQRTNVFDAVILRCAEILTPTRHSARILRRCRDRQLSDLLQTLEVRLALSEMDSTATAEAADSKSSDTTDDAAVGDFSAPSTPITSQSADEAKRVLHTLDDVCRTATATPRESSADTFIGNLPSDHTAKGNILTLNPTAKPGDELSGQLSNSDHHATDAVFALLAEGNHPELFAGTSATTIVAGNANEQRTLAQVVVEDSCHSDTGTIHDVARQSDDRTLPHQNSATDANPVPLLRDDTSSGESLVLHDKVNAGADLATNTLQRPDLQFSATLEFAVCARNQQSSDHAIALLLSSAGKLEETAQIARFLVTPGFRFDYRQPQSLLSVTESQPHRSGAGGPGTAKAIADARSDRRFQMRVQSLDVGEKPETLLPCAKSIVVAAQIVTGFSLCLYCIVARGPPRGPPLSERLCSDRGFLRQTSHQLNRLRFSISPRGPSLAVRFSKPVILSISGPGRTFRASSLC